MAAYPNLETRCEDQEGIYGLSYSVLLCANKSQTSSGFVIDVATLLLSFAQTDGLELWINDAKRCSRWSATKEPERVVRQGDIPQDRLARLGENGVIVVSNPADAESSHIREDLYGDLAAYGLGEPYASVAWFPVMLDDHCGGMIVLQSKVATFFGREEVALFERIAKQVAMAVAFLNVRLAQKERVKELACLYGVSKATARTAGGIEIILQEIVDALPPAWQYPDIASAAIIVDGERFSNRVGETGRHFLRSDVIIDDTKRGFVEVAYGEDRPDVDEGPFLKEERNLIDSVAREVALFLERAKAEEERAKLQDQLRHADRLATIGQLAAGVAHELNEPLGVILGLAQLSKKTDGLPAQVKDDLEKIEEASLHGREVIRKLMLFSRQKAAVRNRVKLNRLIKDALYFFEARCAKKGIEIVCSLDEGVPDIIADASQINQVLINLVVNGIQSMTQGGQLTIETSCDENHAYIVVIDTGCGMSERTMEKAMDPFFTTKDVGEGTGLGLAVVHGIVAAQRGGIHFTSELSKGTRFEVRLPIDGANNG